MNVAAYTAGATPTLTARDAAGADAPAAAAAPPAPAPGGQVGSSSRGGDVNAGVQTAASYVQAASGYLGVIQGILAQMAALAGSGGQSGAFAQLQERLSALVGADGRGGGASEPGATFDGIAIFGPEGGLRADTGLPASATLSVPATNLRKGAIQELIARGAQGGFSSAAASPRAAAIVSAAMAEASAAAAAISQAGVAVDSASAEAQPEGDPALGLDAAQATRDAADSIAGGWSLALAAQSRGPAQAAFGLLQGA